ncbi:MAG: hypothetical protein R3330_16815 [Saprospiraceae bacterium]|nr:hypothetical protein [Saprospiraceae bacterium]
MYKYLLENAGNIQSLALIPLVVFFMVFVGAMIWTMIRNKQYIERMSRLPFEESLSDKTEKIEL